MSTEKNFTVEQMKAALLAVQDRITPAQMLMLKGHYGCRIASMGQLADFGGYGHRYQVGNSQYGGLSGQIAEHLGFTPEGNWSKTFTIATALHDQPDENGKAKWRLDEVVATALEELGWVTRTAA